ncbi:hypothetical protein GQ457_15G021370 [Hibiscus cannabinus]
MWRSRFALSFHGMSILGLKTYLTTLELTLKAELDEVLEQDESLWLQKSRCKWVRDGDRNMRYFHACARSRNWASTIMALRSNEGDWCVDQVGLQRLACSYFKSLFTSDGNHDCEYFVRNNYQRLGNPILYGLGAWITCEEIRDALFAMQPSKASGVDPNSTPISLCTVLYKIVTKVVVLPATALLAIVAIKPPINELTTDSVGWRGEVRRNFSVKSAYAICSNDTSVPTEKVWVSSPTRNLWPYVVKRDKVDEKQWLLMNLQEPN